jgi:hypothetical protein
MTFLALDQSPEVPAPPAFLWRRLATFLYSAAVHGWILCFVAFGPRPNPAIRRPIYESMIRPNERKIIWYRKVPEIVPSSRISDVKLPQGTVKSNKTIVVKSPNPSSSRQLVLQPAPQIKLDHDIQSPNLLALAAPAAVPLPPAPKVAKRFVAPPVAIKKPAPDPLLAEPVLRLTTTGTASALAPLTLPSLPERPRAKPFIAPSATGRPRGPDPLLGEPDPNLASTGTGLVPGASPNGTSNLNAAIIGLNPAGPPPSALPPGSRSAEFSAAPTVGKTATGEVNGGGITLPGLMVKDGIVKDGKAEGANAEAAPRPAPTVPRFQTLLYDDMIPKSVRPTLSAPLRPASRTIPRALEARFHGRFVYAVVIPAPNLPAYTGDWIVWFAERADRPGEAPLMRAPIPLRKTEPLGIARVLSDDRSEARIQLAAVIKQDGRFDSIVLVKGANPQVSKSAIEELKEWDFRPAMRDGAPVSVEVVIEIPFSLAWLNSAP